MESAKFNQSIFKSQDDANLKQSREQVTCKEAKGLFNGQSVEQASNITKPSMRVQSLVEGASGEVMTRAVIREKAQLLLDKAEALYSRACDEQVTDIYRFEAVALLSQLPKQERYTVLVWILLACYGDYRLAAHENLIKFRDENKSAASVLASIMKDESIDKTSRLYAANLLSDVPGVEDKNELVNVWNKLGLDEEVYAPIRYETACKLSGILEYKRNATNIFLLAGKSDRLNQVCRFKAAEILDQLDEKEKMAQVLLSIVESPIIYSSVKKKKAIDRLIDIPGLEEWVLEIFRKINKNFNPMSLNLNFRLPPMAYLNKELTEAIATLTNRMKEKAVTVGNLSFLMARQRAGIKPIAQTEDVASVQRKQLLEKFSELPYPLMQKITEGLLPQAEKQ